MAKLPKKPRPGDLERMFEDLVGAPMDEWVDPDLIDSIDPVADLVDLLIASGATIVSPPILQPADVFLDTAGEDIRRRLFITTGPNGEELCLRPDFTIPVSLEYLAEGPAGRVAASAYVGPVFRHRRDEPGEFTQAGIERYGDADRVRADAETLKLAANALDLFGLVEPEILIGDEGLFIALMEALELPAAVRRRLRAVFGDTVKLADAIATLTTRADGELTNHAGVLAALAGADPSAARAVVEDLLAIAGITAVGGRSAHEIAERFLEQAALAAQGGLTLEKAAIIRRFLAIEGSPMDAAKALDVFQRETGIIIAAAVSTFKARNAAAADLGFPMESARFSASFGRNLDYYTGLVFEMRDPDRDDDKPVLGGGCYDGLLERLGAAGPVPAIGFSMWLDRLDLELLDLGE